MLKISLTLHGVFWLKPGENEQKSALSAHFEFWKLNVGKINGSTYSFFAKELGKQKQDYDAAKTNTNKSI